MKMQLETPKTVLEARETRKGWNWFVELLVFVAVFIVATIGESIILFPIQMVLMFTDEAYLAAVASGDVSNLMKSALALTSKDAYMIGMLFSNIAIILITMLFCKLIQKRKMRTLGFVKKNILKEYGIGLLAGAGLFSAAVLLCVITGSLRLDGLSETFLPGVFVLFGLGFMIQGMAEEVMCRSYLMVSIGRRYPMWLAVLLNALLFSTLHIGQSGMGLLAFINLTLFGAFASIYFIKRGSIWGIGAVHSIWNFVQGNFYGVKVSGLSISCSVLDSVSVEGRELINGGAFGLEGGLAVTLVLVAGILFMLCRPAKGIAETAVKQDVNGATAN